MILRKERISNILLSHKNEIFEKRGYFGLILFNYGLIDEMCKILGKGERKVCGIKSKKEGMPFVK